MKIVFEIESKLKKGIRLTDEQWKHIRRRHKEMDSQLNEMKLALVDPDSIYYSPKEENYHYYKFFKQTPVTEKFLLLVIKHLDEEGYIITAFFLSKIKTKEKVLIWQEKKSR